MFMEISNTGIVAVKLHRSSYSHVPAENKHFWINLKSSWERVWDQKVYSNITLWTPNVAYDIYLNWLQNENGSQLKANGLYSVINSSIVVSIVKRNVRQETEDMLVHVVSITGWLQSVKWLKFINNVPESCN